MTKLNLHTLTDDEFEKFISEPYTLLIIDEKAPKDIIDWETLHNILFVSDSDSFTLEQKTECVKYQLNKTRENDKINNTENHILLYNKHENVIKKIIANSFKK